MTGYIQFHPGVIWGEKEATFDFTEPGHGTELLVALQQADRPIRVYENVLAFDVETTYYGYITLTHVSDWDVQEINPETVSKIIVEEVVEVFYPRIGINFIPIPFGFWKELTPKNEYVIKPWNYYDCGVIVLDVKDRPEVKTLIDSINNYQKKDGPPFDSILTPESKLKREKWYELISQLEQFEYLISFSPSCND
ncbi:MAG: hypothetical protein ABJG41_08985 [Cyclobacteriaceae bacterium]